MKFDLESPNPHNSLMRPKAWTDEDLIRAVAESRSYREVVLSLGLKTSSNRTMDRIRYRCNELSLDRSHFNSRTGSAPRRPDEEVFVDGKQYSATVRRRFLAVTEYKCFGPECGISEWQGKPITLQVEHIDGDQFNNTLENLTLLCPNCHSQTSTWGVQKSKQ